MSTKNTQKSAPNINSLLGPDGALSQALPEYEPRLGQIRMAERVFEALSKDRRLVIEAGTGTGKTCAYLIPAILSGRKIVISTGTKNLEEQIFYKDIPLLKKQIGMKFTASLMKGRRNYICLKRWKRFCREPMFDFAWEGRFFDRIAKWVDRTKTGDRSEIRGLPDNYRAWKEMSSGSEHCSGNKCPEISSCYVNRMRREAQESDIVVVNHSLLFSDLGIKESAPGAGVIPRYDAIIFDEAHAVPDVATSHFGIELSNARMEDLIQDITKALARDKVRNTEIERAALGTQSLSRLFFDSLGGPTQGERVRPKFLEKGPGQTGSELDGSLRRLSVLMEGVKGEEDWERLAGRAREIADDLVFLLKQPSGEYVYWREKRDRYAAYHASPIDLKAVFNEKLYPNVASLVFTSATLSVAGSVEHFKNTIGLNGDTRGEMVGTPFDLKNQAILYVPRDLPDPSSAGYLSAVAVEMGRLVELMGGRAFLLFTSYRAMEDVYARLAPKFGDMVLKQGDAPKLEIIETFRSRPSVLFGTHSFWQGVDVMGDALSLVVIDKLPFAVPTDPVVEARIEWIRNNGGDAFGEYQLPRAVLLLKQGLGRLLRHRNDRGILAVLDPRIHNRGYGAAIRDSLKEFTLTDSWAKVESFRNKTATGG